MEIEKEPVLKQTISSMTNDLIIINNFLFSQLFIKQTDEKILSKQFNSSLIKLVNQFFVLHYTNCKEFGLIEDTLIHKDFKLNFKNEENTIILNNLKYEEVIELLELSEELIIEEIHTLCCAWLAHYYKHSNIKDLQDKFLLEEINSNGFNENELESIFAQESILKSFQERIKEFDN